MSRHPSDRKVYVGDLGNNARKNDLEYVFGAYGSLRSVWIARNPPGFAFVEFESARDAADAVRGLDGRTLCGRRARVELSTGKYARSGAGGGGGGGSGGGGGGGGFGGGRDRGGGGGRSDDKCYECGMRGHFARHCRERKARQRRRSNSMSRSRSTSRRRRTRSKSGTRSRSRSAGSGGRRSGRSRENGRDENGSVSRYSDQDRNGSGVVDSPPPVKRRYDDDDDDRDRGSRSPSPPRRGSPSRRRGDSSVSRSMSRD
ncbi:probable splicing factor, arginine/serine-rich 6 [Drosophila mojavensis]|uniref:RRM domain-containing protein n=1 Tax=Drosophila mojavensis TaxID=7230 RepID=A0A0Q9XCH0_DROMO|nr:probable splicing factor, arginine/serine-rich 6 [Drosophila mojavensis]KRG03306.1 uncharacterized protein Dmoj_GI17744 [Drosophila mojavensis]